MTQRPRIIQFAALLVAVILTALAMGPGAGAQKRFDLTKSTTPSDGTVDVGDKLTITLVIENEWDEPATVRVTDPNPDESALKIDRDSITGGAAYVSSGGQERIEWTGEIRAGRKKTITFKMEALSDGAGKTITNNAYLEDVNNPQTVPDDSDSADIVIKVPLEAPVLKRIENDDGDGEYTLEWSQVSGASDYYLEEADNADFDGADPVYAGSGSQHTVTGKEPGRWYYRVRAISGPLASNWSNTESTDVVVSTPLLAEIDNPFNEPDYLVDWSDVVGATGYTLQEDRDQGFSDPNTRKDIAESQYAVNDQQNGTWYYRVRAEGPTGPGDWSETRLTTVGGPLARIARLPLMLWKWPPPPETPTLQEIENADGDGDFVVRWSSATGAGSYALQEAKDQTFQPVENSYDTTAASYGIQDRGASRLFYRVKSRRGTSDSQWSNVERVDVLWHLEGTGSEPESVERQTNGSVVSGLTYFGRFLNAQDVSDYFYVDLLAPRTVELWLQNIPGGSNWDLALRDQGLRTYDGWYSVRSGNQDEHIEVTVPPGRYFIQVYNKSGSSSSQPYELRVAY